MMKSEMVRSESTTSSEEESHDQQEVQEESSGAKRSYDCTLCKRGFTNARALGGHMNIHRKERTNTAKQGTPNSSLPNKHFTNEGSMASPNFVAQFSTQPSMYYYILESQRNYDMYPQPSSATNPRNHPPTSQYDFLNTRSQSLMRNPELLGTNLSLQIGSSHEDADQARRGIGNDGEGVDLELRLGHDSYSNY